MANFAPNLISSLPLKSVFMVDGKVTYSHVTTKIDGAELFEANRHTKFPSTKPYTSISISNARIRYKNPKAPNIVESQIAPAKLYVSRAHPEYGTCGTFLNKGEKLPAIYVLNPATGAYDRVMPNGELATGLNVSLVITVFKSNGNANLGFAVDQILVNEPIRYYQPAGVNDLSDYGIVLNDTQSMQDFSAMEEYGEYGEYEADQPIQNQQGAYSSQPSDPYSAVMTTPQYSQPMNNSPYNNQQMPSGNNGYGAQPNSGPQIRYQNRANNNQGGVRTDGSNGFNGRQSYK